MPNGTRRGTTYTRKGKTVHARTASIKHPKPQQRRPAHRGRGQQRPLLYATYATAGLAAFELIVRGRFISGGLLAVVAIGFGVSHVAWQHHQRKQASQPVKQPKPKAPKTEKAAEVETAQQDTKPAPKPAQRPKPVPSANGKTAKGPEPGPWQTPPASNGGPTTHEESVAQNGHRCDCAKCTAKRSAAFWAKKRPVTK